MCSVYYNSHLYHTGVSATLIGLSMVYAVNLIGLLQFTVRTSAEMEDLVNMIVV